MSPQSPWALLLLFPVALNAWLPPRGVLESFNPQQQDLEDRTGVQNGQTHLREVFLRLLEAVEMDVLVVLLGHIPQ
jgi:hypothetical protein